VRRVQKPYSLNPVNTEYLYIYINYAGSNTTTDPVVAKARIWTKTVNRQIKNHEYSKDNQPSRAGVGTIFFKRKDIIKKYCNDAGTLIFTVELQVSTEKRSVWFPRLTHCDNIGTQLYHPTKTSDVKLILR
jgi:hypothetical protein